MEVSSHSLQQNRVHGLEFSVAVFTNLTQDHLDYHGTMENYFSSKKILFDNLPASSFAVTNADDSWGLKIVQSTKGSVLTYGIAKNSDVRAANISMSIDSTHFMLEHQNDTTEINSQLVGKFNVQNILAACSVGIALGMPKPAIRNGVASLTAVPGRFERIVLRLAGGPSSTTHTRRMHWKNVLQLFTISFRQAVQTKSLRFFGAGGDRDKTKRPLMGKVVDALSDVIFVTSDNPRTEDPQTIIDNVRGGIERKDNVFADCRSPQPQLRKHSQWLSEAMSCSSQERSRRLSSDRYNEAAFQRPRNCS